MNGITCYLSREEVKELISQAVAIRLEPERLLGEWDCNVRTFDDGRMEVTFYAPDPVMPSEDGVTSVAPSTAIAAATVTDAPGETPDSASAEDGAEPSSQVADPVQDDVAASAEAGQVAEAGDSPTNADDGATSDVVHDFPTSQSQQAMPDMPDRADGHADAEADAPTGDAPASEAGGSVEPDGEEVNPDGQEAATKNDLRAALREMRSGRRFSLSRG